MPTRWQWTRSPDNKAYGDPVGVSTTRVDAMVYGRCVRTGSDAISCRLARSRVFPEGKRGSLRRAGPCENRYGLLAVWTEAETRLPHWEVYEGALDRRPSVTATSRPALPHPPEPPPCHYVRQGTEGTASVSTETLEGGGDNTPRAKETFRCWEPRRFVSSSASFVLRALSSRHDPYGWR